VTSLLQTLEVRTTNYVPDFRGEDHQCFPTDVKDEDHLLFLFHIAEVSITMKSSPLQILESRGEVHQSFSLQTLEFRTALSAPDDPYRLKKRSLYSSGSLQRWMWVTEGVRQALFAEKWVSSLYWKKRFLLA
jgi:hypothetical protein